MSETESPEDPWASVPGRGTEQGAPSGDAASAAAGYGFAQQAPPGAPQPAPGYGYPQPGMPGAAPGTYYYPPFPPRRTNGLSIAALVCGICGFLYLFPAILGIIFGCIALRQIKRENSDGKGMAIGGIVTGSCWLALVLIALIVVVAAEH